MNKKRRVWSVRIKPHVLREMCENKIYSQLGLPSILDKLMRIYKAYKYQYQAKIYI